MRVRIGPPNRAVHGPARLLAADVEKRVLDGGDGLLVQAAACLARRDVQLRHDRLGRKRVHAEDQRRQRLDDGREAAASEILVVLAPARDAAGGGDLQEREAAPGRIGPQRLNPLDAHARYSFTAPVSEAT